MAAGASSLLLAVLRREMPDQYVLQARLQPAVAVALCSLLVFIRPITFSLACLAVVFVVLLRMLLAFNNHVGTTIASAVTLWGAVSWGVLAAAVAVTITLQTGNALVRFALHMLFACIGFALIAVPRVHSNQFVLFIQGTNMLMGFGMTMVLSLYATSVEVLWQTFVAQMLLSFAASGLSSVLSGLLVLPSLASEAAMQLISEALQQTVLPAEQISLMCSRLGVDDRASSLLLEDIDLDEDSQRMLTVLQQATQPGEWGIKSFIAAHTSAEAAAAAALAQLDDDAASEAEAAVEATAADKDHVAFLDLWVVRLACGGLKSQQLDIATWSELVAALDAFVDRMAALEGMLEAGHDHSSLAALSSYQQLRVTCGTIFAQAAALCASLSVAIRHKLQQQSWPQSSNWIGRLLPFSSSYYHGAQQRQREPHPPLLLGICWEASRQQLLSVLHTETRQYFSELAAADCRKPFRLDRMKNMVSLMFLSTLAQAVILAAKRLQTAGQKVVYGDSPEERVANMQTSSGHKDLRGHNGLHGLDAAVSDGNHGAAPAAASPAAPPSLEGGSGNLSSVAAVSGNGSLAAVPTRCLVGVPGSSALQMAASHGPLGPAYSLAGGVTAMYWSVVIRLVSTVVGAGVGQVLMFHEATAYQPAILGSFICLVAFLVGPAAAGQYKMMIALGVITLNSTTPEGDLVVTIGPACYVGPSSTRSGDAGAALHHWRMDYNTVTFNRSREGPGDRGGDVEGNVVPVTLQGRRLDITSRQAHHNQQLQQPDHKQLLQQVVEVLLPVQVALQRDTWLKWKRGKLAIAPVVPLMLSANLQLLDALSGLSVTLDLTKSSTAQQLLQGKQEQLCAETSTPSSSPPAPLVPAVSPWSRTPSVLDFGIAALSSVLLFEDMAALIAEIHRLRVATHTKFILLRNARHKKLHDLTARGVQQQPPRKPPISTHCTTAQASPPQDGNALDGNDSSSLYGSSSALRVKCAVAGVPTPSPIGSSSGGAATAARSPEGLAALHQPVGAAGGGVRAGLGDSSSTGDASSRGADPGAGLPERVLFMQLAAVQYMAFVFALRRVFNRVMVVARCVADAS
eukprot:gene8209-8400_t